MEPDTTVEQTKESATEAKRGAEEIVAEYRGLATELGDVYYRINALKKHAVQLEMRMLKLNLEHRDAVHQAVKAAQ